MVHGGCVLIVEPLTTSPSGIDIPYLDLMSLVVQLFLQKLICVVAIIKFE
jgi:hypothetical protein